MTAPQMIADAIDTELLEWYGFDPAQLIAAAAVIRDALRRELQRLPADSELAAGLCTTAAAADIFLQRRQDHLCVSASRLPAG